MSNTSKGKAREREFCRLINEYHDGLEAMRVPLSGSLRYAGKAYKDDVVISDIGGPDRVVRWRGEVKYRRGAEGFKTLLRWFDDADKADALKLSAVAVPGYLVVKDVGFCALIERLGLPSAKGALSASEAWSLPNFAITDKRDTTRPKTLDKWIDGADFLVLSKAYLGYQIVAIPTDSEPRDDHAAQLFEAARKVLTY